MMSRTMTAIQVLNRALCRGQKKDWTSRDCDRKLRYSTIRAMKMTIVSGMDPMELGAAHNGSCRFHHADSMGVCDNRRKYADRDSDVAAHSKGMAANPRGVLLLDNGGGGGGDDDDAAAIPLASGVF